MVQFPVFRRLFVKGYELFPGPTKSGEFQIEFQPGPTLIAGVNGLGKSTLISVLLRTLIGAYDLPKPAQDGDLGEVEPTPKKINSRSIFAPRVSDGAENAISELQVSFGSRQFSISRRLSDLSILSCSIDNAQLDPGENESIYQIEVARLLGVGSFFDVLLVLRYVVFLLEDRRALVWGEARLRLDFCTILRFPEVH